jgi:hypothetical protein
MPFSFLLTHKPKPKTPAYVHLCHIMQALSFSLPQEDTEDLEIDDAVSLVVSLINQVCCAPFDPSYLLKIYPMLLEVHKRLYQLPKESGCLK